MSQLLTGTSNKRYKVIVNNSTVMENVSYEQALHFKTTQGIEAETVIVEMLPNNTTVLLG
jgi:hypothetical protein